MTIGLFFLFSYFSTTGVENQLNVQYHVILYGCKYRLHYHELQHLLSCVVNWLKTNLFQGELVNVGNA